MIKGIFIPYAGAAGSTYYKWKRWFPDNFQVYFPDLAGRGGRSNTEFYKSIDEAVDDIVQMIEEHIGNDRYFIFGHSMGSLLAYETYYRLLENEGPLPRHLFLSGRNPPDIEILHKDVGQYDDLAFLRMVSDYGGIPDVMFEPEVMKSFLPILRADFQMIAEYNYQPKSEKIKCSVTVLFGDQDFSTPSHHIAHWHEHVQNGCQIYQVQGDHFFIHHKTPEVVQIIIKTANSNL